MAEVVLGGQPVALGDLHPGGRGGDRGTSPQAAERLRTLMDERRDAAGSQ